MAPKQPLGYWIEPAVDLLKRYKGDEFDESSEGEDADSDGDEPRDTSRTPWAPSFNEAAMLRAFVGGGMWSPSRLQACGYVDRAD
eukprot:7217741-Pyramimonas_sp.AAC.1